MMQIATHLSGNTGNQRIGEMVRRGASVDEVEDALFNSPTFVLINYDTHYGMSFARKVEILALIDSM